MSTILTPNMHLSLPVVAVEPSPTWASDLNAAFETIDQHNHTSGSGVQVPADGINIQTDFSLNDNNLISAKSNRFQTQSAVLSGGTDLNCLYNVGVDLYYNDGNGNHIRITQSGGVAGAQGSIAGLASPASATYVSGSQTFIWQSDTNIAANMDAGSLIIRKLTSGSTGITISAPSALSTNYSISLPITLPAAQKFVTLDNSGNLTAPWAVDNSTIEIASSTTVQVKDSGITTAKIADSAVTTAKINDLAVTTAKINDLGVTTGKIADSAVTTAKIADASVTLAKQAAVSYQLGVTSGTFSTSSNNFVDVPNGTLTIASSGRPVAIQFSTYGTGSGSLVGGTSGLTVQIKRNGGSIMQFEVGTGSANVGYPASAFNVIDFTAPAGSNTYALQIKNPSSGTVFAIDVKMSLYEL